jgi:hypothetical protein
LLALWEYLTATQENGGPSADAEADSPTNYETATPALEPTRSGTDHCEPTTAAVAAAAARDADSGPAHAARDSVPVLATTASAAAAVPAARPAAGDVAAAHHNDIHAAQGGQAGSA